MSVITLPDLLTISRGLSQPLKLFLKCLTQRAWAERQGVTFVVPNGDFNLYSFWRETNFQLVPRDIPLRAPAMLTLGPEFVQRTRRETRTMADLHVEPTPSGSFATVMRFGLDAYFTSMQRRPIYASLTHLNSGILAGLARSRRGLTWLVATAQDNNERHRALVYELWSGLLSLFDILVSEADSSLPPSPTADVELRVDLRNIILPADGALASLPPGSSEPAVFA